MCRDVGSRTMQLVLLLLLSLTLSTRFTSAQNVEQTTRLKHPSAGLRGAESRKLQGDTPNSLLIRIKQDTFRTISGYSGSGSLAGFTNTAPLVNLGSWIISLDGFDVGVVTQTNGLFFSQDENSSFRLEGGTQVCVRPQYDIDAQISQIINQFQGFLGGNVFGSTGSVQKYCYALREEDFLNRNGGTNEARVTFTLTPGGQSAVITSSAPLIPVVSPSPPTGSPTSGDSEAGPDFREGDESDSPSVSTSDSPSYFSSDSPSALPSQLPSGTPSAPPSDIPSYLPSDSPSAVPSQQPSATPSAPPSDTPSYLPSDSPSVVPSQLPSGTPSAPPSDIPSSLPSDSPSVVPSSLPSAFPTNIPSTTPTAFPSRTPSVYPSILPSQVPTATPSALPSVVPTTDVRFRDTESGSPSSYLTEMPSGEPSGRPSSTPTGAPSFQPSLSLSPTGFPSNIPTMTPGPTFSPSPIPRFVVVRVVPDISASFTQADLAALAFSSAMTEQQWLVTVDGVDAPGGMLTELVTDSVTAAVSSGSQVCILQIEDAALSRIQDNPGGFAPALSSMDPFAIVYTKDLCYTLRDANFRSLGGEMIAEISFTL